MLLILNNITDNKMRETTTTNTDDTDTMERENDGYSSSDTDDTTPSIVDADETTPDVVPKRQYRRKQPEDDKRRKGNHERTDRQKAATARMLEVRKEMNAQRKTLSAKKLIVRTKAIADKVKTRRKKQKEDDDDVAERLADESDDASTDESTDEDEPPKRTRTKAVVKRAPKPRAPRQSRARDTNISTVPTLRFV